MNVLDLFSGIGGFSLGLERAGMRTVAFCEIHPYAREVLEKNFPGVPIHDDIRTLNYEKVMACAKSAKLNHIEFREANFRNGSKIKLNSKKDEQPRKPTIDVICGGFPCQPFSQAGKRKGKEDDRHLWPEMLRVIQEVRPRWVIGENVAGFINMGLDDVLSDLESAGYETQSFVVPACAVNAPHRRDRVWIIANTKRGNSGMYTRALDGSKGEVQEGREQFQSRSQARDSGSRCKNVAHTNGKGLEIRPGKKIGPGPIREKGEASPKGSWWSVEPDVGRVAHGVPRRVDRLKCLGNAVVPQIPQIIGEAIMQIDQNFNTERSPSNGGLEHME